MALQVRRVITGHDASGRAVVKIDEVSQHAFVGRPGATGINVWTTEGFPASNDGAEDAGLRKVGTTVPNGTIFRILEFAPGLAPRNHRTDSIDYIVVLSGEIDMELDDTVVHLKAGDVMVQRGTIHNWVNRGTQPCVLAVILIAARAGRGGRQGLERGRVANAPAPLAAQAPPTFSRRTRMPAASRSQVSGVTPSARRRCFSAFCVGVFGSSAVMRT